MLVAVASQAGLDPVCRLAGRASVKQYEKHHELLTDPLLRYKPVARWLARDRMFYRLRLVEVKANWKRGVSSCFRSECGCDDEWVRLGAALSESKERVRASQPPATPTQPPSQDASGRARRAQAR